MSNPLLIGVIIGVIIIAGISFHRVHNESIFTLIIIALAAILIKTAQFTEVL